MERRRATDGRLTRNVVPGVHALEHAFTNCYLIEGDEGEGVTLVDAAFPRTWPLLLAALDAIGRTAADVEALVLTHAHFDHVGFAATVQRSWGVPVFLHDGDAGLARSPLRYAHERPRLLYPVRYPRAARVIGTMVAAGALAAPPVEAQFFIDPGDVLPVPGRPRVIYTPGHTLGHCALHLPDRDVVLSGDAIVTLDPYTGIAGAQIVAGAATADSATALASLTALEETGAKVLLPGHGHPWMRGVAAAVRVARLVGPH